MDIAWPKSEGPALTTQGGGSKEPESGTYEAPGQLGLPTCQLCQMEHSVIGVAAAMV